MEALIVVGVVAVVSGIAGWVFFESKRRDAVAAYAGARGLHVVDPPRDYVHYVADITSMPGSRHRIDYLMVDPAEAVPGRPELYAHVAFGRFQYTTGGGEDQKTHTRGVYVHPLAASFPETRIKPEGVLGLAFNDFNTEWEAFNREFDIRSQSERFVSALLNPRMQEFLMEYMRGVTIDIVPGALVVTTPDWTLEGYDGLRANAAELQRRVLPFLWKQHP